MTSREFDRGHARAWYDVMAKAADIAAAMGHEDVELKIRELCRPSPAVDHVAVVSIKPMKLSDGRTDYYVSIKVGDRDVTPHVFREEYKAAYHVALYDWLLNGAGEEPSPVDFGPEDWPARKMPEAAPLGTAENPCPRCHYNAGPQGAERYWEARWRDEKAENERLAGALFRIVDWTMLYATEGTSWPDRTTITDPLIQLAAKRPPTQADADRFKAGAVLKSFT